MVPRETVSFEGPYIKCFVIYLDFLIAKANKQRRRAGNNCGIVSRSGYIEFDQGHMIKNQPITVLILLSESLAIKLSVLFS